MVDIVGEVWDLFTIDFVDHAGAKQVRALFQIVYGDHYLYQDVYDPGILLREIQEGQVLALLASDHNGRPAGYVALARSTTNPHLWEERSLVVDPMYQYTNLSSVLANYFGDVSICQKNGIDCMFADAVCHHYFTQVVCIKAGWIPCALALDELDKSIFIDHKGAVERVSCVMLYWEINGQSDPVYLPAEYTQILGKLVLPLKPRMFSEPSSGLPNFGMTVWDEQYNLGNQTLKVIIKEIGTDWETFLTEVLTEAIGRKVISLQVMLNTACPYLGIAVTLMRNRGFFLGGLLPHYFGTDALFMQKILGKEPDYEGIKLYGRSAKELLAFIRADREAVGRLTGE